MFSEKQARQTKMFRLLSEKNQNLWAIYGQLWI